MPIFLFFNLFCRAEREFWRIKKLFVDENAVKCEAVCAMMLLNEFAQIFSRMKKDPGQAKAEGIPGFMKMEVEGK